MENDPFILIGLSGKRRSGKDSLFNILEEESPQGAKRFSFAEALKEEVAEGCEVSVEYIEAHKENFRLILQGWGTEFRRELSGQTYWLDQLEAKIRGFKYVLGPGSPKPLLVVTDVRFPNEFDFIERMGGKNIRIEREGRPESPTASQHPSETALDNHVFFRTLRASNLEELRALGIDLLKDLYART